jgi:ArsR family transcriptional regulator
MNDEIHDAEPIDQAVLIARLEALAHPARLHILRILAARGTCICGEIVEVVPLAQSTVSQHLKVLKEAGLVRGTIDGRKSCYCLDPAALETTRRAVDRLLAGFVRAASAKAEREGEG